MLKTNLSCHIKILKNEGLNQTMCDHAKKIKGSQLIYVSALNSVKSFIKHGKAPRRITHHTCIFQSWKQRQGLGQVREFEWSSLWQSCIQTIRLVPIHTRACWNFYYKQGLSLALLLLLPYRLRGQCGVFKLDYSLTSV